MFDYHYGTSGELPEVRRTASGGLAGKQCFLIGVAGGTASGKTTVCDHIMQRLHDQCAVLISQDSFYKGLTPEEIADVNNYNFDHPRAFDEDRIIECLRDLKAGKAVDIPVYDFKTHARSTTEFRRCEPCDVIIFEGILVLHMERIRELLHMKIFVDTDDDVRLARRIQRDVSERGRDVGGVIQQYTQFVKPSFDEFVAPSRKKADIIIPWARGDNIVAIDLITEHIRSKLKQPELKRVFPNLEVIPSNYQIRGMHTIVRDENTHKHDFVFYADRLIRLVVEAGLGLLPFTEKTITTPTGASYVGVDFSRKLCGVSIIRSGESMENALRACCKGIKIGKILVHRTTTSSSSTEILGTSPDHPNNELVYEKMPVDIADRYVMLMDPILGTGNTARRAIEVLLDKGVEQKKIFFLTLIAAPDGIQHICSSFPDVRLITSEIDAGINHNYQVVPGVGEFGDRYFCD
mmetsp:Transcript_22942/g.63675  ORF Transcript_22942/g.63675 Transcript_22942/m.63675 type:complete len:463 (+) Transcript_22942:379-1767(+)|eukprot:CAMPEP_0117674668 /NCGR_PEP_ID=MMETSP0804-20121206/15165_1 /TAXON_ID=1074897 /ORGANISM="Tetraselmis astigmatica, Strain CCMP880" /LENGTH=462 /DNA_ID=CAMNT_0005483561 /DNA_START=246 /DNA_END=1634 /DNA_ORIENTATION=+